MTFDSVDYELLSINYFLIKYSLMLSWHKTCHFAILLNFLYQIDHCTILYPMAPVVIMVDVQATLLPCPGLLW